MGGWRFPLSSYFYGSMHFIINQPPQFCTKISISICEKFQITWTFCKFQKNLYVCVQVFPENRCIVKGVSFAHKNHVKEC